jgi:hypothetical protein
MAFIDPLDPIQRCKGSSTGSTDPSVLDRITTVARMREKVTTGFGHPFPNVSIKKRKGSHAEKKDRNMKPRKKK